MLCVRLINVHGGGAELADCMHNVGGTECMNLHFYFCDYYVGVVISWACL